MQTIMISNKAVFVKAAAVLKDGGVVMHPTETCYGLAVNIFDKEALEKLYKIKGMPQAKPVSILVSDLEMAKQYGKFSRKAMILAEKYWPGPLSIVVPRQDSLPDFLNSGEVFVAIRCSSFPFCIEMIKTFGRPVTTTSANLSGQVPLYQADLSAFGHLAAQIDLLVDGGKLPESKPSTMVKVEGDNLQLLRQGDLLVL